MDFVVFEAPTKILSMNFQPILCEMHALSVGISKYFTYINKVYVFLTKP